MPPAQTLTTRLFLVDDSDIFLKALSRFLQRQPELTIVGTARSGIEAVASAAVTRPDVIVLDLAMPGMSGLEAIPLLREQLPVVQIIVLTLLETESYLSLVLSAGADAFISKDNLNETLIPAIRQRWDRSGEQFA